MKIYVDVEQGTEQWLALRAGVPTASNFDKIVTPKKCELSKGALDYALRLCAEKLLNAPAGQAFEGAWMERGKEMEPFAVRQYEWQRDVETFAVGFITTDDGLIGCSPDRLVLAEERAAVEIKCPSPHVHLGYLLNGTEDNYKPQVQGQILVAELEWAHLYSFHPQMPPALIETPPDPEYLVKLKDALDRFVENLQAMFERAQAMGAYQPMPRMATEAEALDIATANKRFREESERRLLEEGFGA